MPPVLLQGAEVELLPMRSLFEVATSLAIELDHPAYDCIYLALAVEHDCRFVTADATASAQARSEPATHASASSNVIDRGRKEQSNDVAAGSIPRCRHMAVVITLGRYERAASVRTTLDGWVDYMHLVKAGGEWKVINVLWQLTPARWAAKSDKPRSSEPIWPCISGCPFWIRIDASRRSLSSGASLKGIREMRLAA